MKEDFFGSQYLRSIAIMGGTFDPIHFGHLMAAETVRQAYNIDKVIFLPTGQPPHKNPSFVNNSEHRYIMSVAATLTNPHFDVSRLEIERDGYSYTIDTIKQIKSMCREDMPLYFITGADAIAEMATWKNPGELFSLCTFIAVTRPGYNKNETVKNIKDLTDKYQAKILLSEIPAFTISSTDIRRRVKNGLSIKYFVPESVETYIFKNGLYIDFENDSLTNLTDIDDYLKENLSKARYEHTIGVADESVKLAALYNVSQDKAYIAGLLHDIAKEITGSEKIRLSKEYGIEIDEYMEESPEIIHGPLGAYMAMTFFGIDDDDILNAIKYHTTGRPGMSVLEKIIFLADFTESSRKSYTSALNELKDLCEHNLDKAIAEVLKIKIEYTQSKKNARVHPLSISALDYFSR